MSAFTTEGDYIKEDGRIIAYAFNQGTACRIRDALEAASG